MRLRVVDIETTGAKPSEIIEIAVVDVVDGQGGWSAMPPRSRLFRPRGSISFHAMAVHHLTPDDFDESTPVCSDLFLTEFLMDGGAPDAFIAHNASFEAGHISAQVTGDAGWICTVKGARHAWLDAPGYSNQVLRYWRGLRLDPNLAMPPHRAAPDAWVTAHILIDLLKTSSLADLRAWSSAPRQLGRIPFGRYKGRSWDDPPLDYLHWIITEPDMAPDVVDRARQALVSRTTDLS